MRRYSINKTRMGENLLYGLGWSAIFFVPMLNATMTSRDQLYFAEVVSAWSKILPYFIIFAVHNFRLVPKLLFQKKHLRYVGVTLALTTIIFVIVQQAQEHILPHLSIVQSSRDELQQISGQVSFTDLNIFLNVLLALSMNFANAGIKLIYKALRDEQAMVELSKQKLQVEMDYLKYQINPHFFMNTLNNIHALIDIDTESAKETVIELSKMMRYVLYESGSESISLRNDLRFIRNYINLMAIRYNVKIETEYPNDIPEGVSIPPLLFIVFVENAFKHGADAEGESYINIRVRLEDDDRLSYQVVNSIPAERCESGSTGIGLVNLRRRLELLYGNNFRLTTTTTEREYTSQLTIPIKQ